MHFELREKNESAPAWKRHYAPGFCEGRKKIDAERKKKSKKSRAQAAMQKRKRSARAALKARLDFLQSRAAGSSEYMPAALKAPDLLSAEAEQFRQAGSDDPLHAAKPSFFRALKQNIFDLEKERSVLGIFKIHHFASFAWASAREKLMSWA